MKWTWGACFRRRTIWFYLKRINSSAARDRDVHALAWRIASMFGADPYLHRRATEQT